MATAGLTIWTIGHSTRTLDEFLAMLASQRIELLADVRTLPGSRRYPQFNKESLEDVLPAAGVEYRHLTDLGGRRRARRDSPNTAWRNESFRGYADYMATAEFRGALARLRDVARDRRTAVMCAEAVWWRCHRSMIADALKATGVTVLHILSATKVEEHPYTRAAAIVDGRLSYGREPMAF
jgi:uncharacterized protein (DUF488 family)